MTTSLRPILAAIQRARPTAFARILVSSPAFAAQLQVASAEELVQALQKRSDAPSRIAVGAVQLQVSDAPAGLGNAIPTTPGASGQLDGHVAVISGAASGLGRSVALGLYKAGACIVATDIDATGLQAFLGELNDPIRTTFAQVDVTNEASVAAGFDAALAHFGRVDSVHCCAGVAPSYELCDFPLDKWELSLRINLTGYFLYGREAARIMRAQGHGGSMVLLSSKSGLEPSKANTAYNATKAGELHMARGWALELGREGIRANCIAPGNVFEGSKIWNPEYIAKAALKKGIRPDEVIPYYNSLTALNREIKGADIANAAVFLASEQARCITGQVIVVDSGQVWAR
jgi:NAD(P)-dependent dehydrogenase (short-subunit alcohol dehydrogenase family)